MIDNDGQRPSFLLADCGSTTTTVALFDLVEENYRLIARAVSPTTIKSPWHDILIGVQDAIRQLSEISGRPLLSEQGDLITPAQKNGSGVDFFGVAVSAGKPLKVIIAGLLEDVSVSSARRAVESIYANEVGAFTLDAHQSEQDRVAALLEKKPELIFISGGADGSDSPQLRELLESLELGTGLLNGSARPDILYAGNSRLREHVSSTYGQASNLYIADNVRPSVDIEDLSDAKQVLTDIYVERKITELPGVQELISWANLGIQPTGRAFATMIKYFGALYRSQVLGVDLGANSVAIAVADQEYAQLLVRSNLGMGEPLPELLNLVSSGDILQWVPGEYSESTFSDFVFNKALHPHSVPFTDDEVYLEQALARALLRQLLNQAVHSSGWNDLSTVLPSARLIVLRGNTLAASPRPGQAVLTVLDALQPTGVFSMAVDRYGVLPMMGILASQQPSAVVQILEGGVLFELGWVIAPSGTGAPGQRALRITVETEDKGEYRIDAEFGELILVPLEPGVSAELNLKPERKVDVGRGPGKGWRITVQGGAVGLVVDVRGRPLMLPDDEEERRNRIRQWHWDMGG